MERFALDHRRLDTFAFALLDPALGDEQALAAWDDLSPHALVPHGFAAQAEQLPRLVYLRALSDDSRRILLDLLLSRSPVAAASLCVALLQTTASAERMAMRLLGAVAPAFPQGQRGLFRFYDPAVFEHLLWMLDTKALSTLHGPVDTWAMPLRGEWFSHTLVAGHAMRDVRFHVNADAWRRVQRIGAIHAVLDAEPDWRDAPSTWGPRAEALLIRAEHHQLTNRGDAIAFATHGLRWHAHLDRHPRMLALLTQCADHPTRYRRLASHWTNADWQTMAAELDAMASRLTTSASIHRLPQGT